jgi:hypothetical protein
VYLAGAIQGTRAGIAALVLKLHPDGTLAYDRAWQGGSTAAGVAAAPDGTLFVSATLTVSKTDAFGLHLLPTGRGSSAATGGSSGTGPADGGGVGVATDGTLRLAATAPAPPYAFASTSRVTWAAKGTITAASGTFSDASDTIADPAQAVFTPAGTTTFAGLEDAALIRIAP